MGFEPIIFGSGERIQTSKKQSQNLSCISIPPHQNVSAELTVHQHRCISFLLNHINSHTTYARSLAFSQLTRLLKFFRTSYSEAVLSLFGITIINKCENHWICTNLFSVHLTLSLIHI